MDFQQYAASQRDKPFSMDCAAKHAKYLPQAVNTAAGKEKLASISGIPSLSARPRRVPHRSSYNSKFAEYVAPEVVLISNDNQTVNFAELLEADQPVMLNFIFTTCTTICPVLTASFEQVQSLLGDQAADVMMISITIDPEYDTPQKLADYSERFSAGSQWKYFTGKIKNVIAVEKAFDIYRGSKTNHEPVIFLRSAGSTEWLRIEGFANAGEIVAEYEKIVSAEGG